MEIHGKIEHINIGNLDARQNTLITLRAEGETDTHAFYLAPEQITQLQFKLKTRTAYTATQERFWIKVG